MTVDAYNVLRVYMQMPEHLELLFKKQITWEDEDDFAVSVEHYMRAKCMFVSSKKGQTIAVSCNL